MRPRRLLAIAGTTLHYLDEGTGEPVLLLHGVNGGAGCWERTVGALAPRWRALAPDLPGWGESPPPPDFGYNMRDLVAFTLAFMDRLGVGRAHLVGWSLGGNLAIHLAHAAPERVRSMALVAPGGLDRSSHWSFRLLAVPGVGEWLLRPTEANVRAGIDKLTYAPRALPEEVVAYLLQAGHAPYFRRTTLQWIRRNRVLFEGAGRITVAPLLPRVQHPTLVLWGENDPLVPVSLAPMAKAIPGVKLIRLPRCGHLPMWEQAVQFEEQLAAFLAVEGVAPGAGGNLGRE